MTAAHTRHAACMIRRMSSLYPATTATPGVASPAAAARAQGQARLASLDSLRGVAVLMVVAFHCTMAFPPPDALRAVAGLGHMGVQLFFIVSAITMAMMWDARADEPARVGSFYIRRVCRIAPMYWLALVAYEGADRLMGAQGHDWEPIVLNLLLLHALSPLAINSVVPGGWSIGVEMLFYALFPLLVARGTTAMGMLGWAFGSYLLLGVAASWVALQAMDLPPLFVFYSLLTQFPVFPLGLAVYAFAVKGDAVRWRMAVALVAAWLLVAVVGDQFLLHETRPFFWIQVFALAGFAAWAVRRGHGLPALAWVGSLSYSIYLLHFGVIDVVFWLWPEALRAGALSYGLGLAIVLVLTSLLAAISRATLERWSIRAGAHLVARLQQRAGARARSG